MYTLVNFLFSVQDLRLNFVQYDEGTYCGYREHVQKEFKC